MFADARVKRQLLSLSFFRPVLVPPQRSTKSIRLACSGLISSDRSIGGQSGIDEEKEQDDKKAPAV